MVTENKNNQNSLYNKPHFWGTTLLIVIVVGLIVDTTKADNSNFYSDIIRLDNVATRIHQNYVEEINSTDLVDFAIKGMLEPLDPHSVFFKKDEYEELRITTEGKFGGLGIQISIRDKILTVMTPIAGTPASRAGIQSGDQIIKIDNKSTAGITVDNAVLKLRGEPGSEVRLSIRRKGESNLLEYVITREIITIKSVPFWGVLDNNVGYIKLTSFSQESGVEVEKALRELIKQNIRGIVLDLRFNPGGLLPQAIEVAEKFLDKNALVVSTRGRNRSQNKEFLSTSIPVLPKDMPVAVLVNAASASASEIVAGAIQDWDRGIVLGDTTFGKGSVQSILPLDKDHHLKLTTAFYYTPSGRCINKPENGIRGKNGNKKEVEPPSENDPEFEDLEQSSDTAEGASSKPAASLKDTIQYKTKAGRLVFGGGGIIPDTIVSVPIPEPAVRSLFLRDVFFKFANLRFPLYQKRGVIIDSSFVIDKKIMDEFYSFLDSINFQYKSYSGVKFQEFKTIAGLVKDTSKDSGKARAKTASVTEVPQWTPEEKIELVKMSERFEDLIKKEGKRELVTCETEVKSYLKESFLVRSLGQDNPIVFRTRLNHDTQVNAAITLLTNKKTYALLLQPHKISTN